MGRAAASVPRRERRLKRVRPRPADYLAAVSLPHAVAIFAAGIAAGTINTVVGSGTLITFPVLLAVGLAPVTANVSNTVGLFPGSFVGAYGYRRELSGQGPPPPLLLTGPSPGSI